MTPQRPADPTETPGRFAGRRVLALGTFDSFVKTAALVGRLFEAEGADLRLAALAAGEGQLSMRQLRAGGIHQAVPVISAEALVGMRLFRDSHIVVAVVDGGRARELFLALAAADLLREPARPLIVIVSPGVTLADHVAGFMSRAPADVIGFNTEADLALYQAAADEIGADATNGLVTGLLGLDRSPRPRPSGRPEIVFFEQPVIPARRMQRSHILGGLLEMAVRFPEADVLVKLRHARDETAHHGTRFHLEDLAREVFARGGRPKNFSFTHEAATDLIERADLVLTVSSTVAIEAMARGAPTRIIADLGLSEALGTSYFIGSGCLAPLAAIRPGLPSVVRPDWLTRSGGSAYPERLLAQCHVLLDGQDQLGAALPLRPMTPAYGSADWMAFALGKGGAVAVHAPHLAERPAGGRLGIIAAVARRLRQARRFTPRG